MGKLRVSAAFNLHGSFHAGDDAVDFCRRGLRFYKELGFDTADFNTAVLDLSSDNWQKQTEEIRGAFEEIGFRFEMGHLPFFSGVRDENFLRTFSERVHRGIDAAAALGIRYAVVHPNAPNLPMKEFCEKQQFDSVMAHLMPFVEHGDRVGVEIVVENMRVIPGATLMHRYCQTPEELCHVADALGIGICWDFGHANISGIRQSEGLALVGKRLRVVHINDNFAMDDEHILPFTGTVDWKDAMAGLSQIGYGGLLNFELAAGKLPEGMRQAYAKYVLAAAEELASYL